MPATHFGGLPIPNEDPPGQILSNDVPFLPRTNRQSPLGVLGLSARPIRYRLNVSLRTQHLRYSAARGCALGDGRVRIVQVDPLVSMNLGKKGLTFVIQIVQQLRR